VTDASDGIDEADAAEAETGGDDERGSVGALVDRAELDVLNFLRAVVLDESADDAEAALGDLEQVAVEAEELLSTVDLSELPEAINEEELTDVVDLGDVSEAVEEGSPAEAIESGELLDLIELGELWSSVDVREFWRNKEEFEAALDDAFDDESEDDEGRLARLQSTFDEAVEGSDDDVIDDGLTDDEGGLMDDGLTDGDGDGLASVPDDTNTEAFQTAIQSGLRDAVDEFRAGLLETHDRLQRLREENEERTSRVTQPDSRNPTAYSTLASSSTVPSAATKTRYSTVPRETKYSTAPNRERIYGDRFEDAGDRDEGDDDE
jgi:hypothetical protein